MATRRLGCAGRGASAAASCRNEIAATSTYQAHCVLPDINGAEAILKLRALRSNDNFDEYWRWHLEQELRRVHLSRYTDSAIPKAA